MNWIEVEHEGRTIRLPAARQGRGVWIGWPGRAMHFGPEERTAAARHALDTDVRAPMTGKVVQVRVRPGDSVNAGDVVVILEAMKMEYRLAAPLGGTVRSVACREGELVDLGRTLVALEAAP